MIELSPGTLFVSRYEVKELLGQGGYGSVYQAWDTNLSRDVALKVLHNLTSAESQGWAVELQERFKREARILGSINHPGLVTVHDFGEHESVPYLVMELLSGRDLEEEIFRFGPIEPTRALKLFLPCLNALGEGHKRGIVHKDLKPSNLFLVHPNTKDELLKIVDFGVARTAHEDKLTKTGMIVGTPQYFSPEYIARTQVSPAMDVYQMGMILAEMLSGAPCVPNGLSFMQTCSRHFKGQLEIPAELLEGDFGEVLKRSIHPDPLVRYQDALGFAQALSNLHAPDIRVARTAEIKVTSPRTLTMQSFSPTLEHQVEDADPEAPTAIWDAQTHATVMQELAKERARPESPVKSTSRLPTVYVVLGLIIVILSAVLVFLLLRR